MKVGASAFPGGTTDPPQLLNSHFARRMRMRKLMCLLLFLTGIASAQQSPPPDLQPIPDGPPSVAPEKGPAVPEVTIRRVETGVIREFRLGGRLYMVDTDGDGSLETRYSDLDPRIAIPAWVLLRW
jgi:hypothetical protein